MAESIPITPLRRKVAMLLLAIGLLSLAAVPLTVLVPHSPDSTFALLGLFLFGIPQLVLLATIATIGRPAVADLTTGFAARLRFMMPASTVSRARYVIGLLLLTGAVLVSWVEPVVAERFPALMAHSVVIGILADAVLLVALFVVGAGFWDKLHALFVREARVSERVATTTRTYERGQVGWRFYLGVAIFVCAFGAWALVPLGSAVGWSTAQLAGLSGGIFVANKIGLLAAVAVMGRSGFNYLKGLIFGTLRKVVPAERVSRGRYRFGLTVFVLAIIADWLEPYVLGVGGRDGLHRMIQDVPVGLLLLASLAVLGGEFWGKLRALFSYRAKVDIVGMG